MAVGERTACHEGGDHVDVSELGEFEQRLSSASLEHAAAHVQDGALGFENEFGGLFDHPWMTLHRGAIAGKAVDDLGVGWPVPLHAVLQHVFRNVDERWARATGGGDMERLTNGERKILGAHHQLVVLGDAAGDAHGVALLEGVGADSRCWHLTGDAHHRDRVHIGVTQWRDHVGGGRATGDHGDAGTAGHVCVALGHVAGALLVTHENVANAAVEQRVVSGQNAPTRKPEHDFGAFHL